MIEIIQIQLLVTHISAHQDFLTEVVSQLSVADLLSFLTKMQGVLGNLITCNIRCHDKDSVFTFDGLPLTIREATLSHITNVLSANVFLKSNTR